MHLARSKHLDAEIGVRCNMGLEKKLELFKKLEEQIVDELAMPLDIGREYQKLVNLVEALDGIQAQIGCLEYELEGPN